MRLHLFILNLKRKTVIKYPGMYMEKLKKWLKSHSKDILMDIAGYFLILLYFELLLYYQLHASLQGFSFWNVMFLIPEALVLASISGWFSGRTSNGIFKTILIFALSLFYIVDLIYFKTFGSLLSASMVSAGGNAVTGFWWSISNTLKENALAIFLMEIPVFMTLIDSLFIRKNSIHHDVIERVALFAMSFMIWSLIVSMLPITGRADQSAYGAYHSRFVDTDTASRKLGVLPNFIVETKCALFGADGYDDTLETINELVAEEEEVEEEETEKISYNEYAGLDFAKLSQISDDETIKSLCNYLSGIYPSIKNDYTGMFEGYNLIYICAESFSRLAIDKEITPTLYKLANNGIVLENYYNSFRNVTTNGEYAFLTGLWPDVARANTNGGNITGTMGQSIDNNMSMALGNMFNRNEGIQSRGYHNYYGYYYGRNQTLPNMGFDCKFMDDGMSFTYSWPASDLEMMEQSVDDYINDELFTTYYMTFSGHGNYTTDNIMVYKNISHVDDMIDETLPISAIGYLSANYELEKAMTYLLERLEEAGILDKTVIVLSGDHYPYYLSEIGYEALSGEKYEDSTDIFKSTCIIYNSGIKEPIRVDTPCCNVDILPTIYNLFGIEYDSRLYAGTDIFGNGTHIAQLYNKSFVTDLVKYDYVSGEAVWFDIDGYDEEYLDRYLEKMISIVKNRYAMSINIEQSDFYEFVLNNYKQN